MESSKESPLPSDADPDALKLLVILNPVAGQEDSTVTKSTIVEFLDSRELEYELRETEGDGDALKWAKEAEEVDLVIVAGGDGTVMEAMSGMIENPRPVPLAQLPLGTANLLTRALSIPTKLEDALELAIGDGVSVEMDVGYLVSHERYFAIIAGSGWDAMLIADATREMKDKLGFFAYIISGVKNLFTLRSSRIRIEIDDKVENFRADSVAVINIGEIHGSGIAIGDQVSPHDGKLDLAIASTRGSLGIFRLLWQVLTKRFSDSDELKYFTASHLKVSARPPLKLEIDGEVIGETPFEVKVVPNGARLVVPLDYAQAKKLDYS